MEPVLAQLSDIDPQNYHAHLLRGIYYFLGERNVSAAKVEINRSRNKIDHTWCYSQAFLHAYEEHLDSAMKSYNAALKELLVNMFLSKLSNSLQMFLK